MLLGVVEKKVGDRHMGWHSQSQRHLGEYRVSMSRLKLNHVSREGSHWREEADAAVRRTKEQNMFV